MARVEVSNFTLYIKSCNLGCFIINFLGDAFRASVLITNHSRLSGN